MNRVISQDQTSIAYERRGCGPAVILVGGGLDDGSENAPLAAELAARFETYNFARRGRGESGDTPPYAVEREIEDIAALISQAGGTAHVYGASSGGMFALEAALAGLPIERIALYEIPYDTSDGAPRRFGEYRARLQAMLSGGRRGDALELFMRLAGSPDEQIAAARRSPQWPRLESLAHTLAYDAALYGPPPGARLARITQPTLVATGGTAEFYESAADAVAAILPTAQRLTLDAQAHVADSKIMAGVLAGFFEAAPSPDPER